MKKLIFLFFLIPMLWGATVTISTIKADNEEAVIEDEANPDADTTYITLVWDENLEDNIAGYNVYYGRSAGNYSRLETVEQAAAKIGIKGTMPVYLAVTAFDTNGIESDFSEEVQWP